MVIKSVNNPKIKEILKLKEIKYVKKNKKYLIEGIHLVEEAIKNKVVDEIILEENFSYNLDFNNLKISYISDNISKKLSETNNNQGIFAMCRIEDKKLLINDYNKVLILDRIQDPGNLGTIIRTGEAFGIDCVILGKGTVSIYNQKVLRSMQGSNFHIDCYESIDLENLISEMKNFDIFATTLLGDEYLDNIKVVGKKLAIIFGNEGSGVSKDILKLVNRKIKIKMNGKSESLNVAISSGIILHHLQNIIK